MEYCNKLYPCYILYLADTLNPIPQLQMRNYFSNVISNLKGTNATCTLYYSVHKDNHQVCATFFCRSWNIDWRACSSQLDFSISQAITVPVCDQKSVGNTGDEFHLVA